MSIYSEVSFSIFYLTPSVSFIVDTQFRDGFSEFEGREFEGYVEYSLFFEFLAWNFSVNLEIPT